MGHFDEVTNSVDAKLRRREVDQFEHVTNADSAPATNNILRPHRKSEQAVVKRNSPASRESSDVDGDAKDWVLRSVLFFGLVED